MGNHYYSQENENVISNPKQIKVNILGSEFVFTTDNGVFSKDYLDYATSLLLKNIVIKEEMKSVLDVGCGYGPIGISLSKVYNLNATMIDVNPRALSLTNSNCIQNKVDAKVYKSNCLDDVSDKFDLIITNPPIRAGKDVVYKIFEQSKKYLNDGGELWLIIQYNHGAPSAIKKLKEIFSSCITVYKKKGFYIIKCFN